MEDFKNFTELVEGDKPVLNGYVGREKNFGNPNKTYKFYLADSTASEDQEEDVLFSITIRTKSTQNMLEYIGFITGIQDPTTGQLELDTNTITKINSYLTRDFNVAKVQLDLLGVRDYLSLLSFTIRICSPK